jgi:hypothetical protein
MLDIPVIGQLRRVIALVLVLVMAFGGLITAAWLSASGDTTLAVVVGAIGGVLLLGGVIGAAVAVRSAGRARSRRPGAPIAASDVRPSEPFALAFTGSGGRHLVWISLDIARDRRPDRETRYDVDLDLSIAVGGRGPATRPLTITWWSGMIEPHVGNLRGLVQPGGRVGPSYHLDLDSTGGRFRAHVMLCEVEDVAAGAPVTLQGVFALPPSFTSGRARVFVTQG